MSPFHVNLRIPIGPLAMRECGICGREGKPECFGSPNPFARRAKLFAIRNQPIMNRVSKCHPLSPVLEIEVGLKRQKGRIVPLSKMRYDNMFLSDNAPYP